MLFLYRRWHGDTKADIAMFRQSKKAKNNSAASHRKGNHNKKSRFRRNGLLWVKKGIRTLDPRNHNPML